MPSPRIIATKTALGERDDRSVGTLRPPHNNVNSTVNDSSSSTAKELSMSSMIQGYYECPRQQKSKSTLISQQDIIPRLNFQFNQSDGISGATAAKNPPTTAGSSFPLALSDSTPAIAPVRNSGGTGRQEHLCSSRETTTAALNKSAGLILAEGGVDSLSQHDICSSFTYDDREEQEKLEYLQKLLDQNRQQQLSLQHSMFEKERDAAILRNVNAMSAISTGIDHQVAPTFQQSLQVQQLLVVPTMLPGDPVNMMLNPQQSIQPMYSEPLRNNHCVMENPMSNIFENFLNHSGNSLDVNPALSTTNAGFFPGQSLFINDGKEGELGTFHLQAHTLTPEATSSDKDKLRRPRNAYNFFFSEEREVILAELKFALDKKSKMAGGSSEGEGEDPPSQAEIEEILESPPVLSETERKELRDKINPKTDQVLNTLKQSEKTKKPTHRKIHGIGFRPLSKIIAQRWKKLGKERREYYNYLAKKDLDRYTMGMDDYAITHLCTPQKQK